MKRRLGMTMIEVLTVVAVVGMLAVLAGPNLTGGRDRRAANSASRQAMMAFRLARSEAIRRQKNVGIHVDKANSELRVYVTSSARDFSSYNPINHSVLRMLTPRLQRGEDKRDWPVGVRVADSTVVDNLDPLPDAYAVAAPIACSFCSGGGVVIATPQGRFTDLAGRPLVGAFSVARRAPGGHERVWLNRVVAFNGMTGSSRVFSWSGTRWR
jgi:prepilin-type N-terminal cleavage/methylation domain-containing protein